MSDGLCSATAVAKAILEWRIVRLLWARENNRYARSDALAVAARLRKYEGVMFDDCRSFVFDMDGTLTHAAHDFDAIRRALDLPEGKPILETLAEMPEAERTPRLQQLEAIELEIAKTATPSDGAHQLLETLRASGKQLGIVTRNSLPNVAVTLRAAGLIQYFQTEHIVGRDNARPKPDPEGLLRLFSCFGHEPRQGVMIGDYLFDLECGRRAGARTVHYAAVEPRAWPELTDLRISSFAELMSHL